MNRRTLCAALALAGAAIGCGAAAKAPAEGPTAVVRSGPLEDRFIITGELAAVRSQILRAPKTPVWMISIKWMVDEGAIVKTGDKVVEFDTSSLSGSLADKRLAVQRAQSDLISDAAKAASAEADKRMEVERKRVAFEKARAEAAVPADLRPRRESQEKQLAVAREEDGMKKAAEELDAQRRTGRLDRRIKEIALQRAERDLKDIESRLDELALRAPRDGLVQVSMNQRGPEARKFQIGDSAYVGTEIATMPDLSEMQVRARLHDVDEGAIKTGMRATCVLDAYPDRPVPGVVETITPMARPDGRDGVRRVFDVVVKLDRTEPDIMLPGMSVRVEVVRRKVDKALLVPRQALHKVEDKGHDKTVARLRGGGETEIEIDFCAIDACAVRKGPPEGTALALPPAPGGRPS